MILLVALVGAAFVRCLSSEPIWDDPYLTIRNPNLDSWAGIRTLVSTDIWSSSVLGEASGYYRPIASLSYALNRFIGGNSSASYHAGNVILHVLVAIMLLRFITVRRIATGARAFACVMLVATMPLVAEPVSWIAGRYDLLGMLFALVALDGNVRDKRAWLAPIAYALAVLSKEPFTLVILLIALDDVLVWRRSILREVPKYAALVAVIVGSLVLRRMVGVPPATRLFEQGGVMTLARAYAFGAQTLGRLAIRPVDLCFFHTYAVPTTAATLATLAVLAVALVFAVRWRWRAPSNRSRAGVLMGLVWCAMIPGVLTAPTLHVIGDRYAYFALGGLCVGLAGLVETLARRSSFAYVLVPLVVVATVAQLVRLQSRLAELHSEDTMFAATLARDPDNFTTLSLLGNLQARRGQYGPAEATLSHARGVAPTTAEIDTALAFVHVRQRRYAEAEADGWRAVADKPQEPRAWVNLASALVDEGKSALAVDAATHALDARPRYAEAHYVRAIALLKLGRIDAAHDDLVAALAVDPSHAQARALLDRFHAQAGP